MRSALHYPPIPEPTGEHIRAGAHEDINAITLLLGAEEAGLELLTRDGHWIPVSPKPGQLVINIGDMLQRLTNGKLRSTSHRVVNPSHPRYSMPFFIHFRSDFLIDALPQTVPTAEQPKWPATRQTTISRRGYGKSNWSEALCHEGAEPWISRSSLPTTTSNSAACSR